jgi:uncharacterized protein
MKRFRFLSIAALAAAPALADVTINEIRIDHAGSDTDEYFELAGLPGEDLSSLTYVVIGDGTGGSGIVERAFSLSGAIPADGYLLAAGDANTFGAAADLLFTPATDYFENSDNLTHLLVTGWSGAVAADLDTNDDGVLDLTPWTTVVDIIALIETPNPPTVAGNEWYYGPNGVGPDGTFVPGHVYRLPNGNGPWSIGPFDNTPGIRLDTPGSENVPEPTSLALLALGGFFAARRRR